MRYGRSPSAGATDLILPVIPSSNPRPATRNDVRAILQAAWAGSSPQVPGEGSEQARREAELTATVLASFRDTPDERTKTVMRALTSYLHAFIREVRLTEQEWNGGIAFLTETGHITDDKRQEFILLSDVLGASMQTITVNNEAYGEATEATVFGPFFLEGSPQIELGGDITGHADGEPCWVEGTVTDTDGDPMRGARIEVWEADEDGFYDVQYDDDRVAGRAHLFTDGNGAYRFWGLTPPRTHPARRPCRAAAGDHRSLARCARHTCISSSTADRPAYLGHPHLRPR